MREKKKIKEVWGSFKHLEGHWDEQYEDSKRKSQAPRKRGGLFRIKRGAGVSRKTEGGGNLEKVQRLN